MKKRLISRLLVCMMIFSLLPMSVFAADVTVSTQEALNSAVGAADAGDKITIDAAGTYTVPGIPKNITIQGAENLKDENGVPTVVFNCAGTGSIASIPNGATFENVTMNFGQNNYHGFQHAGTINMTSCVLNGLFFSYGDMNFNGCTFNQEKAEYLMWLYGLDCTFTNCTFNGYGKFFNVYNEGNGEYTITVDGCTANNLAGTGNKAVFNSKETCGAKILNNRVVLKGANTYTGAAPTGDIVLNSFVQVDDRAATKDGKNGVIVSAVEETTLNGEAIPAGVLYKTNLLTVDEEGKYHIADLAGLKEFAAKASTLNGKTVILDADIDLAGETWPMINGAGKNITFDGQSHTISNMVTPFEHDAGFFKTGSGCTIKNVNFDNAVVVGIGRLGVVCGHGMCVKIENCKVTNSTVTAVVTNNDDGDKAGAICGYLSGEPNASVTGCTVDGCTITGYRDVGGAVGYAGGTYTVSGNTVKNTNIFFSKGDNYKKYESDAEYHANQVIGEAGASGTVGTNTATDVTVKVLAAGTVDVGEGEDVEVTVDQKSEVVIPDEGVPAEIKNLDEKTKGAISENTAVTGVKLTTKAAGGEEKSGLQAVVNAAVEQNTELATAIATAETVNIEVKVDVIPKEFKKSANASESAPEVIGTVTFELKPTATVTVGSGEAEKSATVPVENSMIDQTKPITVSIYTGFEPVKIVHTGDDNFEEVFRKTGDKTFTYKEGVCTLTISHFSELKAVAKVYVAQTGEEKQYETLQAAVDDMSTDATTITLLDDVVLTTGVNIPENKKITVNGQNHTITINASASQYVFGNGTVSTEGLKGASELTVNNVNFVSSTKGQNYGVITGSGFKGKVSLNNCSFKNLYTAVYMNPNGAVEAELSITNCEYDNTTWGYSVDTVSSPGSDKVNVKTTFTGNNIDATKTFEIFGVAAIYENGKQIGQYNTLAAAMTAAAAGENKVITILPGTIKIGPTETLTIASAGITLKGVRGEKGEYLSKIIRDQIPSGNNMFIYVNAANITFEDLYIEYEPNDVAWNQRNRPILTSAAADNFAMKNCYLKGPDKANMLLNPGDGADNGLIEGNTFEGGSSGIYIRPCNGTVIKNNTFINNGNCITFEPGETTGFQNVQVSGNTFNIDRKGGTVTGGSRGNTGDYASTIGIKIIPEVKNTTNQGWGDGNSISGNTFVNNSGEATYVAYAVIPRSGANDNYTNELIDRISDSFKTDNILPAGALMGYKEVGTTNAATQFSPIVYVAQINETKYFSLASAIKAAGNDDVIELVKNVTIAAPVNVTKAVSIDGKGFTLTLSNGNAIFNAKNNVNNDGISESLTVKNLNMVMNSEAPAQSGYAVIAGRGAEGFAISFDSCSFKNMWCGAILNGCGTGTVAPDVTIKNSTFENVAHGVSFAFAEYAGTVTFTGNRMSGETDIQEVFTTGEYVKIPTVKVTDGYYTADPTAYLANGYAVAGSDVQGYAYMVTKVDLPDGGNSDIGVVSEQPKVEIGSGIAEGNKTAVENAAKETEVAGLGTDALKEAAKVDADSAKAELEAALETTVSSSVTVFAQTYLDVKPTAYSAEDATKVYTVDIKPMVQLIATTAANADDIITDTEGENAVALGDPVELKVNTPVVVTIPLPTGFAAVNDTLYVKHTKDNGASYLYKCAVQKDANDQLYIQFVNNNGFSTFEITTKDTSVASIVKGGSTLYYTSLRAAVEAVQNDETITLTSNCGEAVTVARAVSFTLDKNGKTFSGSITPGANYKNTGSANEATISYVFTYVAPSGGGGATSYTVSAATATHGKVTVDKTSASAGDTVTITVAPDKGFTLETLTVKDAKGNEVALTAVKTGETYTFKMPADKVTVSATFMEDNTMLNFFVDVKADDYFYDAVLWAAKNGITSGVDATHFAPMAITTRGQMVTFLWRAAGCPEPTEVTCEFTDVKASEYYYKAVLWAVETGITKGTSDTTFSPDANVSRSQTVTFLARMSGVKDDAAGYSHSFADVSAADYFNNAVAWAYENKITDGTSATTFSPDDDCLRGQIVTFLYRNFVK